MYSFKTRFAVLTGIFAMALVASGEAAAARNFSQASSSTTTTMNYNGTSYVLVNSDTCADGSSALKYHGSYWCPDTSTSTSSTSTASSGTSTTSTSTSSTSTTSTSTTSTSTTTPTSYAAQLSWTIPTTRTDGTPLSLSELAGYEVYYTNDAGTVSQAVTVSGGDTTATAVSSLASGTYYFSISAIDTTGLKSPLSTVVPVTFP